MITARFTVRGETRETREVEEQWLERAFANRENILLADGNTYRISSVRHVGSGADRYALVELTAPQFARGS